MYCSQQLKGCHSFTDTLPISRPLPLCGGVWWLLRYGPGASQAPLRSDCCSSLAAYISPEGAWGAVRNMASERRKDLPAPFDGATAGYLRVQPLGDFFSPFLFRKRNGAQRSVPPLASGGILAFYFAVHRPVAPQGRARPLSVTGRPSSSDTVCPPNLPPTTDWRM